MQTERATLDAGISSKFRIAAGDDPALPRAPLLGAGWHALQAVIADGLAIIELQHSSGRRAEWFFDGAGRHSNDMSTWSADTRDALRTAFRPSINALRDALLFTTPAFMDLNQPAAVQEFLRLGPALRAAVASKLQDEALPEALHCSLDVAGTAPPSWADPAALRRTLSTKFQHRVFEAMQTGAFTWPSPIGGADMPCTGAFTIGDFNNLFRFADQPSGLDVFVLATEHLSRVAGLYVPAHGVVISLGGDQKRMLLQHFSSTSRHVLENLAYFADALFAGRAVPEAPMRFATFLRGGASAHLGHQLWNELTAIDALVAALPPGRLPEWLIPGLPGNEIEFYGRIDVLFPEIANRVRRGFADQRALVHYAYANRLTLFRATREHIGDGLRRRIMAHAVHSSPALPSSSRTILIGLRVENRTATDLDALCALVIEEAIHLYSGCTIVFDGHNARGGTRSDQTISSHREGTARHSPLAVERAVVAAMRQRFAEAPVTLLDTLGEPLAVSLMWSQACDGFVALWGAGLAKYRWAANKPGLIVTSPWNLRNKGDLHIYNATAYMADPTPLAFVPAEALHDRPEAPMLVPFDHPSYSNFSFDPAALRAYVRAFLSALDGPPEALAALAIRPGRRHGSVDLVDFAVRGWAICDGEDLVTLDIVIDGAVIGRVACDMPRPDLLAAGYGTETAGFGFIIPEALLDGTPHALTVRYPDGVCLPLLSPNTADPFAFRLGRGGS